ncbi:MAG: methyltransferase domain-containing protein [Rhodospirillales bacterium]|nr:methyltransferase domain-containing protein [Rhodospirillales bacterium]
MAKGFFSKLASTLRGGDAAAEVLGESSSESGGSATQAQDSSAVKTTPAVAKKIWPATRLNIVERVWGEGFVTPGGTEQVKKLLPLMDLDQKKSVLVLGSGLGGIHQTIVESTGAWVTGLERDSELAELGQTSMARANLKRQAPIHYSPLEHLELKPKSFDAALSFEGTDAVMDKKALFAAVADALRLHGELRFSTLALPDTHGPNDLVKLWLASEPKSATPHPWPVEALQALLASLNMEVRPVEDITADYHRWVMGGFMHFLSHLSKAELVASAQDLMSEVEYWTTRINAIDSGGLKVVRFHAIKLPEKRKSVAQLTAARKAP